MSPRTISRLLLANGYRRGQGSKKPFVSEKNRKARLEFAKKYKNLTVDQWKKWVWSDETYLSYKSNINAYRWIKFGKHDPDVREMRGTVKNCQKTMYFGTMGNAKTGIIIPVHPTQVNGMTSHLNGEKYRQILIRHAIPSARELSGNTWDFKWMQDGASPHTARVTTRYLANRKREHHEFEVIQWPAQSPDLNPIENAWAYLDRITKDRNFS